MARVNLEERLFGDARLRHLAKLLNFSRHTALGLVAMLWHDSQEMGVAEASTEEILLWSSHEDLTGISEEALIDGLVRAKFLDRLPSGNFLIRGNEKQIAEIEKYKARAVKAAEARWHKGDATSNAQASSSSNAYAHPHYNAMQSNSMQSNTGKKSESVEILDELAGIDDECFSQVTASAQRAWVREFGIEVVKNIVPTAHAAWSSERPKSRQGIAVPLPIYVRRCLENHKRYPRGEPTRGIEDLLAERDAKEKRALSSGGDG